MLRKKVALMQTVIGIGPISAMVVLAYLPDIGQLTKGQAARLAGLAPINNDSGRRGYLPPPWRSIPAGARRASRVRRATGHGRHHGVPDGGARRPCRAVR